MSDLIEAKIVPVELPGGGTKEYVLSKLPALDGRKVALQYPTSGMPKIGEYAINEDMMILLMSYVAVVADNGQHIRLNTRALIDNHIASWETLVRLEGLMISYNCSFFTNGKGSTFLDVLKEKAKASITEILTGLLAQSSSREKQP